MQRRQWSLAAVGTVVLIAGIVLSLGPPEVTLHNTGLTIAQPWTRAAARLAAALGTGLLAIAVRRRWLRVLFGGAAGAVALLGLELLAFRIDLEPDRLSLRGLFARRVIPWAEVARVESKREAIVVEGARRTRIRLVTRHFRVEQRAILERAIARRVATAHFAR